MKQSLTTALWALVNAKTPFLVLELQCSETNVGTQAEDEICLHKRTAIKSYQSEMLPLFSFLSYVKLIYLKAEIQKIQNGAQSQG